MTIALLVLGFVLILGIVVIADAFRRLTDALSAHTAALSDWNVRALVLSAQIHVLDETLRHPLQLAITPRPAPPDQPLLAPTAKGTH